MSAISRLDIQNNKDYTKLLSLVASLSGMFSDSTTPFIHYRAVENLFCRCFAATNVSRNDSAFDAHIDNLGIGIKTFTCKSNSSSEKIAEFNSKSDFLRHFNNKELAIQLSNHRNDRILSANNRYDVNSSIYHIVARREKELLVFNTDYSYIDIDSIVDCHQSKSSLSFSDKYHKYSFNFSKSTLFREFLIPADALSIPVDILADPFELLEQLLNSIKKPTLLKGKDFVILPLFSMKNGIKFVPEKSGLNQWNAGGRKRALSEVYIPIPKLVHRLCPNFFPPRDQHFTLLTPAGDSLQAKVCQDNSKALMTNPNKALSDWLLRKTLLLKPHELATIDKLNSLGFDSVEIVKEDSLTYRIDIAKTNSYSNFIDSFSL